MNWQHHSTWQPMDTAPKGGGAVKLVTDPGWVNPPRILLATDTGDVYIGYWDWYYAEGGNGCTDGVAWVLDSGELFYSHFDLPVAWMDLPTFISTFPYIET